MFCIFQAHFQQTKSKQATKHAIFLLEMGLTHRIIFCALQILSSVAMYKGGHQAAALWDFFKQ